MKRFTWTIGIIFTAGVVTAFAQPPGGPGRGGPGGPGGGPGGPGGNRPPMPVIEVLDADHDHVISASELKNATSSLLTLDKNHDGKLTENEFGPEGGAPGGRRQGGNGRGTGGTGRRPQQGPPGGGGERGPNGPERNEDAGPPPPNPARMVEHAMEFDLDKDGKLSQNELAKFAEDFERHHHGPGGPGESRPNDLENDRPSGTDRPRRPD